jgi:hypothetical protein
LQKYASTHADFFFLTTPLLTGSVSLKDTPFQDTSVFRFLERKTPLPFQATLHFLFPEKLSIARKLIDAWLADKL